MRLSALLIRGKADWSIGVVRDLRFPLLEFSLSKAVGVRRIGSRGQTGFFEEISPAFVAVRRALAGLEFVLGRLSVLLALDDFDHSVGAVGPDVVPDDGVGRVEVVACQNESIPGMPFLLCLI